MCSFALFQIHQHYYGITTSHITEFCKLCPTCQLQQPKKEHPPLRPIIAEDFMERIQIDLIDMRHSPDGEFNWIGHFADHMSKFNIIFPCKNKSAAEVARLIEERVLAYVGPPHIFHSDNGREFVNHILQSLLNTWSSNNVTFVSGPPRHSQSQGMVERGNRVIEEKIASMKTDEGFDGKASYPWASWLPRIMFNMNTQYRSTIKDTPYKLVFGQKPHSAIVPGAPKQIVLEEQLGTIVEESAPTSSLHTSPSTTSADFKLPASPISTIPESASPAKTWVIKTEKVITWTSSPSSSSELPSLPSTPSNKTSSPIAISPPSSKLPSLPSTPAKKLTQPTTSVPPFKSTSSCADILTEECTTREGPISNKCKEADSPESRHENIRKKTRNETCKAAVTMAEYYNKSKCTTSGVFSKGDRITFLVPKIDRCNTDMHRLPGIISDVTGGEHIKYYKVATNAGIIKTKFRSADLSSFTGDIHSNTEKEVSIREASLIINAANKFTVNRCKCKGKCTNGQCSYIRSNISCTTHCHPGRPCQNKDKSTRSTLNERDHRLLQSAKSWLSDNHMNAANIIFKNDYPCVDGLQDTLLQQNLSWDVPQGQFVQFLNVKESHWITITDIDVTDVTKSSSNSVYVYDSLHQGMDENTKKLIGQYYQGDKVKIYIMDVQQQQNGSDCGAFAVAFAKAILMGKDPTQLEFIDPRSHLALHLPEGSIPEFPAVRRNCSDKVLQKEICNKLKEVPVDHMEKYSVYILSLF